MCIINAGLVLKNKKNKEEWEWITFNGDIYSIQTLKTHNTYPQRLPLYEGMSIFIELKEKTNFGKEFVFSL